MSETIENNPNQSEEASMLVDIGPPVEVTSTELQFDLPKKKRGPKVGTKYKPRKKKEETQVTEEHRDQNDAVIEEKKDDEKEMIEVIEELKPDVPASEEKTHKVFITGRMFLFMINLVAPSTFAFIYNLYSKESKVKIEDLRLAPDEIAEVEELADEVTKDVIGNLSPMTQLLMFLGIAYGSKLMFAQKYKVKKEEDDE